MQIRLLPILTAAKRRKTREVLVNLNDARLFQRHCARDHFKEGLFKVFVFFLSRK